MTDKDDSGVLGSLPATRPTRLGGERRGRSKRTATRKPAARNANGAGAAAKSTAAGRTTPPAARRTKPPTTTATPGGPRAVRAGAPELEAPTATERAKHAPDPPPTSPPSGTELVTTAIQAAGELAQIGLTVGGQILKRAAEKLPKP